MNPWMRHHALSFALTLRRYAASPLASALNTLVIGVALALPLGGYVILANVQQFARGVATHGQISVFLAPGTAKPDIARIERQLRATRGVTAVEFVSREQALAGLQRSPEIAEVIASLRDNPLPDAFVVTFAAGDATLAERLEREFRAMPNAARVQTDSAWMQRVRGLLAFGQTAVVLMAILLGIALVAVTFNTIRLQILTQHDEIEVSKLVGATNAYIRRPFYYLGAVHGILGGLAAWAIVGASIWILNRDLGGLATLYGTSASLRSLSPIDGAALLAFAAGLGWLGAFASVSKHLYQIEHQ